MKILLVLLASLGVTAQASAAPVYLVCNFPDKPMINVTADEQAGTVSTFAPTTGYSEQMRATFTSDQVLFRNRLLTYSISRVDLSIARTINVINSTDLGKCVVKETPQRAF